MSVRTLHHYDQIGLLPPSGRSDAGYRLYSEPDLQRLRQILFYRELGSGSTTSRRSWLRGKRMRMYTCAASTVCSAIA